ncbi:amidase [Saccharopolyspora sp. NPDC050389]|uniref:amidase n=1 Tax=Saccharopolyspora sp. NPDC050389 TaxID=3155516 RepID=UPI0033FA7E73
MDSLADLTIVDAAAALRAGRISAVELMAAVLARARATEPLVNAYAYLDYDAALSAARDADRRLSEGQNSGPLHGIPIGIKDLIATREMPTEAGSAVLTGNVPAADAAVVRRLRAAGAIIVGKHRTHEFGIGMNAPPTRNPWDLSRYPGGSTAGGGVSVAVGSSLAAIGTDGGGSIRKPAAINGVVGLKPTIGAVNADGLVPGGTSVDHIGWLTRSVADAALLHDVLADRPGPGRPAKEVRPRIGCPAYFFDGIEEGIAAVVRHAVESLAERGAEIVPMDIPGMSATPRAHTLLVSSESARLHQEWMDACPQRYHPASLRALQAGAQVADADLQWARGQRRRVRIAIDDAMDEHDLDALCTPTLALPPVPMAEMDPERLLPEYCRLTLPFNLSGHPAASVNCGTSPLGLPVGVQIVGRRYCEPAVLRLASMVESPAARPGLPATTVANGG